MFGFYLPDIYLIGFGLAVVAIAALYFILYRTTFGRAVRATMQNQTAARLIGIDVNRVAALTFGIGTAVTAIGGMVYGAISGGFTPEQRLRPDLPAAGDRHPGRHGQHRRRARRGGVHDHRRGARRHLAAGLGGGRVLPRDGDHPDGPADRPVRPPRGEGPVTEAQ